MELPEFWENKQADQTLEVLMSDLDPAVMDQFYMKDGVSANDVTRVRPPDITFKFKAKTATMEMKSSDFKHQVHIWEFKKSKKNSYNIWNSLKLL